MSWNDYEYVEIISLEIIIFLPDLSVSCRAEQTREGKAEGKDIVKI